MRFCIPVVGKDGLGNALFPWAKAFIASSELNIPMLAPTWKTNPRGYSRYFKSSRFQFWYQAALVRSLPCFTFREADFKETGEAGYASAIHVYAEQKGLHSKSAYILFTEGMWGGFQMVCKAKPFVWATLYNTPYTLNNLYDCAKVIPNSQLNIAVHIRLGDFKPPQVGVDYRGLWNTALPLGWYMNTCRSLKEALGAENVSFILMTDSLDERLSSFIDEFQPITTTHQKNADCSDLLVMAHADLLICSMSSYSMWGAYLSDSPYIWYKPGLYREENGSMSIWGKTEQPIETPSGKAALPRGVPVDIDGAIPEDLISVLKTKLALKTASMDLLSGGSVA